MSKRKRLVSLQKKGGRGRVPAYIKKPGNRKILRLRKGLLYERAKRTKDCCSTLNRSKSSDMVSSRRIKKRNRRAEPARKTRFPNLHHIRKANGGSSENWELRRGLGV